MESNYDLLEKSSLLEEFSLLLARSSQFDFSLEKAHLLTYNLQANQFHLSQPAEVYLNSLQGECYIISISGNPLVGKSSLLNLLVSLFTHSNTDAFKASQGKIPFKEIFAVGDGRKATTEEIDMYCVSIQDKNYIFLDVEGDNDPSRKETGVWIYTNLIQTAVSVSHVHLYNFNGISQETFLNYFESIHKTVKQNELHLDFQTKHMFLKRNHIISPEHEPSQELEELKSCFDDERLTREGLDYSVNFLTTPPQHIIGRKSASSCLASTGFFCENCQEDSFTTILLDIYNELTEHLKQATPFKSGKDFLKALERIVKINTRDLPFFPDQGHIIKIRSEKLKKEQSKIQGGLLKAEQFQLETCLSKDIGQIMADHPNLAKEELMEKFTKTQVNLAIRISKMEYLMPEICKFVEKGLLDDSASILDEKEKDFLLDIYVSHFKKLTEEIIADFQFYKTTIGSICKNLREIKIDTETGLKNYLAAVKDMKVRSSVAVVGFVASGITGVVGRDLLLAVVLGAGTGVVGASLAVASLIHAKIKWNEVKKKNEESLNTKKIAGINNEQEAEKELKRIGEFVKKLLEHLQESDDSLQEICSEEKNVNFVFTQKIEEAMDHKVKGTNLPNEMKTELIEVMKAAQKSVEKFQRSL